MRERERERREHRQVPDNKRKLAKKKRDLGFSWDNPFEVLGHMKRVVVKHCDKHE